METILVTGAAGFIGYHYALRLLSEGYEVVGVDNCNDYYEVGLKRSRLEQLVAYPGFKFYEVNLEDAAAMESVFKAHRFGAVVHLAAQAGVRYSLENPQAYVQSNMVGFLNVLEGCRHYQAGQLIYASSSSVYGANTAMPFSVADAVNHPVSLYAASKKSNELMAHAYSHLYGIPTTGLRFFTVYGPWGRPDMAYYSFARDIVAGRTIRIFNHGRMKRDFTYVDDVVEGMVRLMGRRPEPNPQWSGDAPDPGSSYAPYRVYNIGNHQPVELMKLIGLLEQYLGCEAKKEFLPMQPGDVLATYADVEDLARDTGFAPRTSIEDGIGRFVGWYREYYG